MIVISPLGKDTPMDVKTANLASEMRRVVKEIGDAGVAGKWVHEAAKIEGFDYNRDWIYIVAAEVATESLTPTHTEVIVKVSQNEFTLIQNALRYFPYGVDQCQELIKKLDEDAWHL